MKNFLAAVIILLLWGCATISVQPVCRHNAVYAAITWSDRTSKQVGIAVGYWNGTTGVRHAQAFSISPEGKIIWLILFHGEVTIGKKDNFSPYEFLTIKDFGEKYIKINEFSQEQLNKLINQLYER